MGRNYNELTLMLNTQATHYDCSNNIIIPRGFIPGGRDGSVQAFSDNYHVTGQNPNHYCGAV